MKYTEAYEVLDNYQFQDWNSLTDEYKQKLDDMKEISLKALKICALNDRITNLYNQYNSTSSPKSKRDLYKAIKRLEGERRKEKLKGTIVI